MVGPQYVSSCTMIKILVLCLALAAAAQGASRQRRMVGGDVVNDSTYSFQVGIRPVRTQAGVTVTLPPCTGVLISGAANAAITGSTANWLLTSATCVQSGTTLQLFAGRTRILRTDTPDETVQSANAIIHEDFFRGQNVGDLAILPLATIAPANTGTTTITAATLVGINEVTSSYLASSVNMAGWGYPNNQFHLQSPSLRSLSSRVVPNVYCSLIHLGKPITNKHICTGGLFNKGPCTGDSGAPLVVSSGSSTRVIGLATLTPQNGCSKGKPGVFTRLGQYLEWIVDITQYDPEL